MAISASDLINAKIQTVGVSDLAATIEKSRAYFAKTAYPTYGDWPAVGGEQHYPKLQTPLPEIIIKKSAGFLMKTPPRFYVKDNETATTFLREVLDDNALDWVAIAQTAGVEGAIWLKYTYDSSNTIRNWKINVMGVEEVIPIYDPHDISHLMMVRVQYQYQRPDGSAWWYREEWTDEQYVVYEELPSSIFDEREALEHAREGGLDDDTGPWRIATSTPNAFGVIPFQHVKNLVDPLNPNGYGDVWGLWDVFDRINVAYDNMDESNQFGAGPVTIFKEADNAPYDVTPHQSYSISGPNADVIQLEHQGNLRGPMQWYAEKLESMSYSAVGIVNPKLEDVAGLGQLSYAALQLLHGPLIEYTDRKRDYWGKRGVNLFLEKLLRGASRWSKDFAGADQMEVVTEWPDYFPMGGVDKQIEITNIKAASEIGLPVEDTVKWLAKVIGIHEEELPDFLKRAQADAEARRILLEATQAIKNLPGQDTNTPGVQQQAVGGGDKGAARKQ
ncbi:MAG TPA: hypothetical protein DG761_00465 [Gammaproteobacteria bacterium]|nr:hypothetical protein [Gammaproteobacteria bacterium]|tara:strand:- start:135 stop:1640 length:1506 start_codon:yes stop_codon:yes gene_type:complete